MATDLPSWAGDDFVWVEDRDWLVPAKYSKCRHSTNKRCPNPPVADLSRGRSKRRFSYCADHLYGRNFEDGKVLWPVAPNSTAAQQGWIGGWPDPA